MVIRQKQLLRGVRHGFTLMEILVVVAIIVILAGLGGYYLIGQVDGARKGAAKTQIRTLTQAAENYNLDNLTWPPNLQALTMRTANGKGPYLKNADYLIDPWGNPYQYDISCQKNNGTQPDIWSIGPPGTNQFIGNWSQLTQ
jgi:general secretion pathway protein G